MNIIRQLSFRSLQKNRTTTLVIILGIIMSVALMTGLFLFSNSLLHFLRDDYASKNGTSEIVIHEIDSQTLQVLPRRDLIQTQTLISLIGVEKNDSEYYPHSNIVGIDEKDINTNIVMKLSSGRFPERAGEALITPAVNEYRHTPIEPGEEVSIDMLTPGQFSEGIDIVYQDAPDRKLTIVGVLRDNPLSPPMRIPTYFVWQTPEEIRSSEKYWAGFSLSSLSDKTIKAFLEGVREEYLITSLAEYSPNVSSEVRLFISAFVVVLLVIVTAAGVNLIHNGFLISLSQRMRALSILSSVGMTRRQKWRLSFREGMLMYLIGLPVGMLLGFLAMRILFIILTPYFQSFMETESVLRIVWDPMTLIKIALVAFISVFIATLIPAFRTSAMAPLMGIRRQDEIKLKAGQLRSPVIIRTLFGIEGEIAWKNLRRNRRKYRTTLISLVLSLVLYLSFASLMHYVDLSTQTLETRGTEDISIYAMHHEGQEIEENFLHRQELEQIANTEGIERSYVVYSTDVEVKKTQDLLFPDAFSSYSVIPGEMISYDPVTMKELLRRWDLTEEELKGKAVIVNQMRFKDDEGAIRVKDIFREAPERLNMSLYADAMEPISLEVSYILPESPGDVETRWGEQLKIVVLPETMEEIVKEGAKRGMYFLDMRLKIFTEEREYSDLLDRLDEQISEADINLNLVDEGGMYQRERDLINVAKILFFGFATIIAMISLANIYNMIISSLRLRRKEFAMLRSVGMEEKAFRRMMWFESAFYAAKLLLYGIPLGALSGYVIHRFLYDRVGFLMSLPVLHMALASLIVVMVLLVTMNLGSRSVRKGNILESLKMDMEL